MGPFCNTKLDFGIGKVRNEKHDEYYVHTTAVCVLVRVWAKDFGTREVGICFANPDRARYIYIEDPLPEWFTEQVVLRYFTGVEVRLSGSNVRNQLYIGTAPKLQNLADQSAPFQWQPSQPLPEGTQRILLLGQKGK